MARPFRPLAIIFQRIIQQNFELKLGLIPHYQSHLSHRFHPHYSFFNLGKIRAFQTGSLQLPKTSENEDTHIENLLKNFSNSSKEELEKALDNSGLAISEGLVLNVLKRHKSDWNLAFWFFNWVSKSCNPSGYLLGSGVYYEMLEILCKMKRFEDAHQVLDEMSKRGFMNERAYGIMVRWYASAHRVDDAIDCFYKRKQYGLKLDLVAFVTLLMWLCRYKHVEAAELLFRSKKGEFQYDVKTWNIILNGWCVVGSLREANRFWSVMIGSECKPDRVSYAIFINYMMKSRKFDTAIEVFYTMWEQGCNPDVEMCNNVIDRLCYKERVHEALQIFKEMNEKGCQPDFETYNCLIKHLCKIEMMEKAFELLGEMEEKGGSCFPDATTFRYLLNSSKNPEEVSSMLERMNKIGCKMTGYTYHLLMKLYMKFNCEELVRSSWTEMVGDGIEPHRRSYTVMIRWLNKQGRIEDAMNYFNEMTSKGMIPKKSTRSLVDAIELKQGGEDTSGTKSSMHARRKGRTNISFVRR